VNHGRAPKPGWKPLPQANATLTAPFRRALALTDGSSAGLRAFIRSHVLEGVPRELTAEVHADLVGRVSAGLGLTPAAVSLVGSCRLGFAIKKKIAAGGQRYCAFNRNEASGHKLSDVDVAVVSAELFTEIWDAIYETVHDERNWVHRDGRGFVADLFHGVIDPDKVLTLPAGPAFDRAAQFKKLFEALSGARVCGNHQINGRLYHSRARLEAYQEHLVRECYRELPRRKP
jgi:hypothetical protein